MSIIAFMLLQTSFSQGSNNALNFDGVDDYVTIDPISNTLTGLEEFTIEFWMRSTAGPAGNGGSCMFAINNISNNQNGLLLMIRAGGQLGVSDLGDWMDFTGQTIINDGDCHHIAYVRNGTVAYTYVDGILQLTDAPISTTHIILPSDRVSLAQEWDLFPAVPAASNFYNGDMDDLRIWYTARTAAEISSNMNTNYIGSEAGLIGLYKFDQGIAGGFNTGITNLENSTLIGAPLDGILQNLTLDGAASNFLQQQCFCLASSDPLFTTIIDNVEEDTYWTGKIYIPDYTIIEVNNAAVLDLTNVDLVFGQCAGIDFTGGAQLRANNSVFRPCSVNDTWRGIKFREATETSHQINESTFKNAEVALNFESNSYGVINANTFLNCNEGVFLRNSLLTNSESIIANSFVTNSEFPEHQNCYKFTDPTDIIHVHVTGLGETNPSENPVIIAQNNMAMTNQKMILQVTGIDLYLGNASITENKMTNLNNGIVIQSPLSQVNIESNEIEYNSNYEAIASSSQQIAVFNANGPYVLINSNELTNTVTEEEETRGAIFIQNSKNIAVQHNVIDGFDFGISSNLSTNVNISENVLTSIGNVGIFLSEGLVASVNFITCNDVTMIMGRGVSVWTSGASRSTQITSNCLKDGREGIKTEGGGFIPFIRNNYLYNYSIGINNIGHGGNIGSFGDPGINTLWSNNTGAMDIASTTALNVADNFGMFNVTFGFVLITSSEPFHSTASCGHQIFDMPSQGNLNTTYTCDNSIKVSLPLQRTENKFSLPTEADAIDYLSTAIHPTVALNKIAVHEDCTEAYLESLINAIEISVSEQTKMWYNYYKTQGDFTTAMDHLNALHDPADYRFKSIETLSLSVLNGIALSESEWEIIATMSNDLEADGLTNLAVTLSKLGSNHGTYNYTNPVFEATEITVSPKNKFEQGLLQITAFPNPVNDKVTLQILNGQNLLNQRIMIYNIQGELIMEKEIDFVAGQIELNLASLATGSYYAVLASEEGISIGCKLSKK